MVAMDRPEYTVAVTQNVSGPIAPDVHSVLLRGTRSGKRGNKAEGAEAVAEYQQQGSHKAANWLIDANGEIFELAGWDRAAGDSRGEYVIYLAQPTPEEPLSQEQYHSLGWLMDRLTARKNIPRARGAYGYSSELGPIFDWSMVEL